jgi:hypothetical protein
MIKRLHLVVLSISITATSLAGSAAAPATVSGVVRDGNGIPQIGAVVQLLRPDLSVVASVYTNSKGRYSIPAVLAGRYSVKAMGTSFLPSMREDVRVRSATVVNLTLNTLYEVMQWLPAQPRDASAPQDDWKWTLRSAANRPLLRWLEDGPLVVVTDGSGAPRLKARLMAGGQEGSFGERGERFSAALEDTPSSSRELLASVDFDPSSQAGMESMLGFRQDLGYAGSVQSLAAVSLQPTLTAGGADSLDEAIFTSAETIKLGDEFDVEAGSEQVIARFNHRSPNTVTAALPAASIGWHDGDSTVRYSLATALPDESAETDAGSSLPRLSMRNGELVLEHGLHQELGWQRLSSDSAVSVLVYSDHIDNPVVTGMGNFGDGASVDDALMDRSSHLLQAAGPGFTSSGLLASFEHSIGSASRLSLSYAVGNGLALSDQAVEPASLPQALAALRARRAQTLTLALSGTLEGTGTRWHASYQWQPAQTTLSPVTSFAAGQCDPFLNLMLHQALHRRSHASAHVDGVLNVRNLLAQGYHPFLLSDGSVLVLAQDPRAFSAGLAFTF